MIERQTVSRGGGDGVAAQGAGVDPRDSALRVDRDACEPIEPDEDRAREVGQRARVMAGGLGRDRQAGGRTGADQVLDIGHTPRVSDRERSLIDFASPRHTGVVIARVAGKHDPAAAEGSQVEFGLRHAGSVAVLGGVRHPWRPGAFTPRRLGVVDRRIRCQTDDS